MAYLPLFRLFCPLLVGIVWQLSAQTAFQKVFKSGGSESAYYVLENTSGYLLSGFTTASGSGGKDAYLLQIDKNGEKLWESTYGGPNDDEAIIIEQGSDGGYLLFGHTKSTGNGDNDVFLIKVDESGIAEWTRTVGGAFREVAPLFGTLITLSDGYIISGPQYSNLGNGNDFGTYIIRLDQLGNIIWSKSYETGDENYLVANYVEGNTIYASGSMDTDGAFATFNLSTGAFTAGVKYTGNSRESLYHLMPTNDDNFILSDHSWSPDNGNSVYTWVSKVDKSGAVIWSKAYYKLGYNIRSIATPTPDGGLIIVPYSPSSSSVDIDGLLIKTNANGDIEWSTSYGTDKYETFYRGSPTQDGGFIAVGKSTDNNDTEHIFVVKTDGKGSIGECCVKAVIVESIDYATQISSASMFTSNPFSFNNWNNISNAPVSLTNTAFCSLSPQSPPTFAVVPAICGDTLHGEVTIEGSLGNLYSFNGGPFLPPTTYKNLPAGPYIVVMKVTNGCQYTYHTEVPSFVYKILDVPVVDRIPCTNSNTISLQTSNGIYPFQYRTENGNWGNKNVFEGLFPGDYLFYAKDSNLCHDTLEITILPYAMLQVDAISIQEIDCAHAIGSIQIAAIGGANDYLYAIGTSIPQTNGFFPIMQPGNYKITITDVDGCTFVTPVIDVNKNTESLITEEVIDICSNQTIVLPDSSTTNRPGVYTFQLKATDGCDSTHIVRLSVTNQNLYIPNVFHPNNDGTNDWFTIYSSTNCIKSIKYLHIYDRWGSLLFERKDFPTNIDKLGWDGTIIDGQKASVGVYIYDCVLELTNGLVVEYSGDITLIR